LKAAPRGSGACPICSGALLFALATGLLVFGAIIGPDWGWGDPRVVASFALAALLGAWFAHVGAALGVVVAAIIGTPSLPHALAAFDDAWRFAAVCLIAAGLGCLLVGRVRPEDPPALADAARAVFRDSPGSESVLAAALRVVTRVVHAHMIRPHAQGPSSGRPRTIRTGAGHRCSRRSL
jgi:hypothetical protein